MAISAYKKLLAGLAVVTLVGCSSPVSVDATAGSGRQSPPEPPGFRQLSIASTADSAAQDVIFIEPQGDPTEQQIPLVVYLHGSSVTYTDILRRPEIMAEAEARGWLLASPNFRGPLVNHCGNELAQQDILDTVNWALANYPVDASRIYLIGFSGGGFMSMIMAHRYPDVWAAVSSWSGFPDLLANYAYRGDTRYGEDMRTCFGGDPNVSAEVTQRFRERSPITYFTPGVELPPLDLNGQKDDPNVPVDSQMLAFRALAPGLISDEDIGRIRGDEPVPTGTTVRIDAASGREIFLRRELDNLRVTIRAGDHEVLGAPAFEWFDQFQRP